MKTGPEVWSFHSRLRRASLWLAVGLGLVGLGVVGIGVFAIGNAAIAYIAYAAVSALGWESAISPGFSIDKD